MTELLSLIVGVIVGYSIDHIREEIILDTEKFKQELDKVDKEVK